MLTALAQLYARDLAKVCAQLEQYPDEAFDLGGVAYTRDRQGEFSRRSVPRSELLAALTDTSQRVQVALLGLDESSLAEPFPRTLPDFPADMTTGHFLLHLYGQLNWHLGQLDYHRRVFALKSA